MNNNVSLQYFLRARNIRFTFFGIFHWNLRNILNEYSIYILGILKYLTLWNVWNII